MFLGIEIGGTKLQIGLGQGDGKILTLWRGSVDATAGGEGIRAQIGAAIPELLARANVERSAIIAAGVGFGGPTDDATQRVIKSHHIAGWTDFPLGEWLQEMLQFPTVICNDADVAGLAEAIYGAGRGLSPIFYITVGTGIGGGLIIDRSIYRGVGKGAAEIGHLLVNGTNEHGQSSQVILEQMAAGWGIADRARVGLQSHPLSSTSSLRSILPASLTTLQVAQAAQAGDPFAQWIIDGAIAALGEALRQVIALLCPRRIIIGGGVSLMGEERFFAPLRRKLAERPFEAFAGLTEIVPAELGEEVVVHGALALARNAFLS